MRTADTTCTAGAQPAVGSCPVNKKLRYEWGVFGHLGGFGRNPVTLAYVLGMESFKSYVVTNNTYVDRYDPSYPA